MSKSAIQMIGEWDKQVNNGLQSALRVIVATTNKTLPMAVARCMIGMAQFMGSKNTGYTRTAKKNREVFKDGKQEFVQVYRQDGNFTLMPRWKFNAEGYAYGLKATWDQAKRIANAGMARRSWFWGLRNLPGAPYAMGGKPYPGVAKMMKLAGTGTESFGMVLENRLSYILKPGVTPSDYESRAVMSAGNRIMKDAARKLEVQVGGELNKLRLA